MFVWTWRLTKQHVHVGSQVHQATECFCIVCPNGVSLGGQFGKCVARTNQLDHKLNLNAKQAPWIQTSLHRVSRSGMSQDHRYIHVTYANNHTSIYAEAWNAKTGSYTHCCMDILNPWVCTVYLHWMWPSTQYHLQPDVCSCLLCDNYPLILQIKHAVDINTSIPVHYQLVKTAPAMPSLWVPWEPIDKI